MVCKTLSYICQALYLSHFTLISTIWIVLYLLEQTGQLEVRSTSTSLGADLQGETSHHQIPKTGQVIKSSRLAESLKENNQSTSNSLGAELVMK